MNSGAVAKKDIKMVSNTQNALVRYEFMEFLLRCAILKFCENKAVAGIESEADSVKYLNVTFLEPHRIDMINSDPYFYDLQEWRK